MIDDPGELERRAAYLETLRAQGRSARFAGFILSLVGVMILVIGRFRLGSPTWALMGGAAIVALAWALFVYAVGRRLYWVRAHPYSNAAGHHG